MAQSKLVADKKQEKIKAQHTYELHYILREDSMENKQKFVIEVCAQAMIPKQEISEIKFTDSRKKHMDNSMLSSLSTTEETGDS